MNFFAKKSTSIFFLWLLLCLKGSGALLTSTTNNASEVFFSTSAVDLINVGTATLASEVHSGYLSYVGVAPISALNNGSVGFVSTVGGLATVAFDGDPLGFFVDGNWTSTYHLNLNSAPLGYRMTEVRTIAGWSFGRGSQKLEVLVSYINDSSFISLGTFSVDSLAGGSSQITLTDSTGTIAIGVDAIRFNIMIPTNPGTQETTYRELDVFGSAIPDNTPVIYLFPTYSTTATTNETVFIDGTNAGAGAGNYGQIISSGAVTLNGGTLKPQTTFTGSSGFTPAYGQSFTVLSGSSVTGSYTTIDNSANPASLKFVAEYQNNQVNVVATPGDYARDLPNLTPSQQGVGRALNSIVTPSVDNRTGVVKTDREKITAGLLRLGAPQLQSAIAQLDPSALQGMSQTSLQSAQAVQSGFTGRLDQLQSGTSGGFTVNGVPMTDLQGEYDYEEVASLDMKYAKKKKKKLTSYWINGTGNWGDVESEAQKSGYRFYGMGSQIGMDQKWKNGLTTGLMLWEGYSKTRLATLDSKMESHRGGGGIYLHKEWRGLYWGGYVGAGKVFYETDRSIDFLGEHAKGKTEGTMIQGWNELGYEMRWRNWGFGPTAGVGYDRVMIDRYKETGSAAALALADQTQESLRHQIGFRIQSFWKWAKVGIQPSLRMSWDREYFDPKAISARFVAGGSSFDSPGRELDTDTMNAKLGLSIIPDQHWTVTTSYQTQLLAEQYSSHNFDLGVRYGF